MRIHSLQNYLSLLKFERLRDAALKPSAPFIFGVDLHLLCVICVSKPIGWNCTDSWPEGVFQVEQDKVIGPPYADASGDRSS